MRFLEYISYLIIPLMIVYILLIAYKRKIKVYDCFINGVLDGAKTTFKIFPNIFAIITAISVFKASGAMDLVIKILQPVTNFLKIPKEIIPLGFMSSISGGASLGILTDILKTYGADSVIGKTASTILGSSETTLYVLAVYLGAVKIKEANNALWIGLICDVVAVFVAIFLCR